MITPRDSPLLPSTATVAAPGPPGRADHRYYAWPGATAFAVVVASFARTYYLKFLFDRPALPALLHLYGALMTW